MLSIKLQKEMPDDGSCEQKHVAVCNTSQCCVGRQIFVCLWDRKTAECIRIKRFLSFGSPRPLVCPYETTRHKLMGFWWSFVLLHCTGCVHSLNLVKVGHQKRSLKCVGWLILTVTHCILSAGENVRHKRYWRKRRHIISVFVIIREKELRVYFVLFWTGEYSVGRFPNLRTDLADKTCTVLSE